MIMIDVTMIGHPGLGRGCPKGGFSFCWTSAGSHVPKGSGDDNKYDGDGEYDGYDGDHGDGGPLHVPKGSGENPILFPFPMFRFQVQLRRSLALRLAGECSLHQTGGESK